VPLFNIQLGEVSRGVARSLRHAGDGILSASSRPDGGRTPEYLGKKVETKEVKLAMLYVLVFPLVILAFSAWSSVALMPSPRSQRRPHGLSRSSTRSRARGNNGSAFAA